MALHTLITISILLAALVGTIIVAFAGDKIFEGLKDWYEKEKNKNGKNPLFESSYGISAYGDLSFPYETKLQAVGADFPYKNSTVIVNKNGKLLGIDNSGKIEGVTKEDFPLYYSFKEPITNGSYLFKDVKFIQMVDLSKMNSSQMVDASSRFENSNV